MFRTLIVAAGITVGGLAAVPPSQAADGPPAQPLHFTYEVWYRTNHHDGWRRHGTYHTDHAARHASDHLRHHGYQVRIDTH